MQRFVSHSVQDTEKIAAKLAERLKGGEVIAFTGSMGMGKTAFTRGLVLALGGGDVEWNSPITGITGFPPTDI